jgi:hypothetical protein
MPNGHSNVVAGPLVLYMQRPRSWADKTGRLVVERPDSRRQGWRIVVDGRPLTDARFILLRDAARWAGRCLDELLAPSPVETPPMPPVEMVTATKEPLSLPALPPDPFLADQPLTDVQRLHAEHDYHDAHARHHQHRREHHADLAHRHGAAAARLRRELAEKDPAWEWRG